MAAAGPRDEPALGHYLREIEAYPILSREDEVRLGTRIRAGDESAVRELVTSNLRFVVMMARRYRRGGDSLADLVNEGNLGLMRAARRFDERKGVRFVTYASWWVRQSLMEATSRNDHLIRVPRRKRCRREYLSLEDRGPDGRVPLGERLPASATTSPERWVRERELRRQVIVCVAGLPEREAQAIRLFFGLDDGEPLQVTEVARRMGVSPTRVRQLRDRGLQRLGSGPGARMLAGHRPGGAGPPGRYGS